MRISEVTVQNYRSISALTRFQVGELTTLVGPNNEGKSNLLRALATGMAIIERWGSMDGERLAASGEVRGLAATSLVAPRRSRDSNTPGYRWELDYPLAKQERSGTQPTTIRIKFQLTPQEVADFLSVTGISNNGDLPIEMRMSRNSASFGVVKPGRGAAGHKIKAREIARFISDRVSLVSVPAIRTAAQAETLVNDLVRIRLRAVAASDRYRTLMGELNEMRQEAVSQVGDELADSVRRYLSTIQRVQLESTDFARVDSIGDIYIDDGTLTPIANKGDGVKSLITMALIHGLAQARSSSHSFVLAVDEPEAHLHSATVHELQVLFQEISKNQQVILATHNPIFVNRDFVDSNILVQANEAKPARTVSQIRNAIGVLIHDNMLSAEIVVLVEGVTDERVLPKLLMEVDAKWKERLASGRYVFRATKGAGKVRAQIQREKATVCRIVVVLDCDNAGREEAGLIEAAGLLDVRNVFLLKSSARTRESELEDLLRPEVYLSAVSDLFGREFRDRHFQNSARKWSENFQRACEGLGVAGDPEDLLERAKVAVATAVEQSGDQVLRPEDVEIIGALSGLLER